jgi:uncharacterized membrane protein YfcA
LYLVSRTTEPADIIKAIAMDFTLLTTALALVSGALVGIVLGLIGGGGSVLAVPLLVYVVGVPSPHVAIGTSAIAVAINAAASLGAHARLGTVKWRCAFVFGGAGVVGAFAGSLLGKAIDGSRLLALFGVLMVAVGVSMLRSPENAPAEDIRLTSQSARYLLPPLLVFGAGVGLLSGFFGIGGGFLIVPGLMLATGMPLTNAIGTSLVGVTAFGLTTAASYAASGLIDWWLALLVVVGGFVGSVIGTWGNARLRRHKRILTRIFASVVIAVGTYVIAKGLASLTAGIFAWPT